MADRQRIMDGVWQCIVEEWGAGNFDRARNLERFLTALETCPYPDTGEDTVNAPLADEARRERRR